MRLRTKKQEPEIATASMADIAFLLIVFFMLTTVFSANKGMEHILPPKDEEMDTIVPEDAIYIKIFPSHSFEIDGQNLSIDQVEVVYNYVNQKVQINAKKPIIIHTNRQADYGDMVQILDQLMKLQSDLDLSLAITIPSKKEISRYEQLE